MKRFLAILVALMLCAGALAEGWVCADCGRENKETYAFCPGCGGNAHVPDPICTGCGYAFAEDEQEFAFCPACGTAYQKNRRTFGGCIEGEGFDTPEDAAMAYFEAWKANDVWGMLSTFATQSYAENVDVAAQIARIGVATPSSSNYVIGSSAYARKLTTAARVREVINSLYNQYYYLSLVNEDGVSEHDGTPIRLNKDDVDASAKAFVDRVDAFDFAGKAASAELVECIRPEQVISAYSGEKIAQSIAKQAAAAGAEEITDLLVHLQIGGTHYVQCLNCIRYDGKWYNYTLSGTVGALIGLGNFAAGLAPMSAVS